MRFLLYCNAALFGACLRQLKILVGHLPHPRYGERLVKHAVAVEFSPTVSPQCYSASVTDLREGRL